MVRIQCDGKNKKNIFFCFCVEMSSFFAKILARVILLEKINIYNSAYCGMKDF